MTRLTAGTQLIELFHTKHSFTTMFRIFITLALA